MKRKFLKKSPLFWIEFSAEIEKLRLKLYDGIPNERLIKDGNFPMVVEMINKQIEALRFQTIRISGECLHLAHSE